MKTVVDRAKQQLGQIKLDGLPETLAARLQFVAHAGLPQQTVEVLPASIFFKI